MVVANNVFKNINGYIDNLCALGNGVFFLLNGFQMFAVTFYILYRTQDSFIIKDIVRAYPIFTLVTLLASIIIIFSGIGLMMIPGLYAMIKEQNERKVFVVLFCLLVVPWIDTIINVYLNTNISFANAALKFSILTYIGSMLAFSLAIFWAEGDKVLKIALSVLILLPIWLAYQNLQAFELINNQNELWLWGVNLLSYTVSAGIGYVQYIKFELGETKG